MKRNIAIIALLLLVTVRFVFPDIVSSLKEGDLSINTNEYLYNNAQLKSIASLGSTDEFNIHSIDLDANKLLLNISYKGCRPHNFEVNCDGEDDFIVLSYDLVEEDCESYIQESLAFDLERLNTNVFNRSNYMLSVVNNRASQYFSHSRLVKN